MDLNSKNISEQVCLRELLEQICSLLVFFWAGRVDGQQQWQGVQGTRAAYQEMKLSLPHLIEKLAVLCCKCLFPFIFQILHSSRPDIALGLKGWLFICVNNLDNHLATWNNWYIQVSNRWVSWGAASLLEDKSWGVHSVQLCAKRSATSILFH